MFLRGVRTLFLCIKKFIATISCLCYILKDYKRLLAISVLINNTKIINSIIHLVASLTISFLDTILIVRQIEFEALPKYSFVLAR